MNWQARYKGQYRCECPANKVLGEYKDDDGWPHIVIVRCAGSTDHDVADFARGTATQVERTGSFDQAETAGNAYLAEMQKFMAEVGK